MSVWSSTEGAWSGSIAVGDDELVVSGTQLTGGSIMIPLEDEERRLSQPARCSLCETTSFPMCSSSPGFGS